MLEQIERALFDELNARAQATRAERTEFGEASIKVDGRPYSLHVGDEIQIRHTLPQLGSASYARAPSAR